MYTAKSRGKAGSRSSRPAYTAAVTRLELKADLERASTAASPVRYQPIFALADGALDGFETLVRWRHPDRGEVGPGDLPLAEETGLIVPIGRWVLVQACRQAQAWRAAGGDRVKISVNLAARQLRDPDVVAMVAAVLAETGLEPDALHSSSPSRASCRTTRSAPGAPRARDPPWPRRLRHRLLLAQLPVPFPIETLKIDRSFTSRLGGPDEETALVKSVIQLATSMGMETVGEIERPEQLERLRELGCTYGQGYLRLDRWTPSGPRPWPPPAMSRPAAEA